MRTGHKLTVFTLADGTAITTRSALETRWAIFFNELGLKWKYEPATLRFETGRYTPDFRVEGLGFVEIKPTLDLLICESSKRIEKAARNYPDEKIYCFCSERVGIEMVALFHGKTIFAPKWEQMVRIIDEALNAESFSSVAYHIEIARERANRSKLDHFVSVAKVLELETIPELARKP